MRMANAAISKIIDKSENNNATIETLMKNDHATPETLAEDTELNTKNLDSHVTAGDTSNDAP